MKEAFGPLGSGTIPFGYARITLVDRNNTILQKWGEPWGGHSISGIGMPVSDTRVDLGNTSYVFLSDNMLLIERPRTPPEIEDFKIDIFTYKIDSGDTARIHTFDNTFVGGAQNMITVEDNAESVTIEPRNTGGEWSSERIKIYKQDIRVEILNQYDPDSWATEALWGYLFDSPRKYGVSTYSSTFRRLYETNPDEDYSRKIKDDPNERGFQIVRIPKDSLDENMQTNVGGEAASIFSLFRFDLINEGCFIEIPSENGIKIYIFNQPTCTGLSDGTNMFTRKEGTKGYVLETGEVENPYLIIIANVQEIPEHEKIIKSFRREVIDNTR